MARYKPRPGWTACEHHPVWQHATGLRVHSSGCIAFTNKDWIFADYGDNREPFWRWLRIAGGNQKRALMMMALDEWRKRSEVSEPNTSNSLNS